MTTDTPLKIPLSTRRERATALLMEDAGRSDRLIASLSGMCREAVKSIRRRLEASGRAVQGPCRGIDGKTYEFPARKPPVPDRIRNIRWRAMRLLRDVRSPEVAAEFGSVPARTRDHLGRLALELAAEVSRLRKGAD